MTVRAKSLPPYPPQEPAPNGVAFPDPRYAGNEEIVAIGEDFSPATLLTAYRGGIFPWPHRGHGVLWFSPSPRTIFPLAPAGQPPHWSRSLRRTLRRHPFVVTIDAAFNDVVAACGTERPATWITPSLLRGYATLHARGWAHSVEVWEVEGRPAVRGQDDDPWVDPYGEPERWASIRARAELVGGIYGVTIGAVFAGESMFHRRTDASKIAFASLVERLAAGGFALFDVQVMNDHLASLGCLEIARADYLDRLAIASKGVARLTTP